MQFNYGEGKDESGHSANTVDEIHVVIIETEPVIGMMARL